LGWILAGINAHEELADSWVFKGGTCLKKCYFETYRFSEDLDSTLRDDSHLDEEFLRPVFEEVVAWITEQSGLNVPPDQNDFDIYNNPRGHPSCQGKIGYRGPVSPTSDGWPKIKLDLTADERLVLPSVQREVFHPYSDRPEAGIWANCYAYEEAFGEKLRALGERTRPRDLYDVVNLYRHTDSRPTTIVILDVLRQKCEHKAIAVPTFALIEPHRQALEAMWSDMLTDQLPVLPPLNDFWDALPEIFTWLTGDAPAPQRAFIQRGIDEVSVHTRTLPMRILSGHAQILRSSASQRQTICVWISPTKTGFDE
jgi:predicted nucleotidyltransferase component of viral defense system